MAPPAPYVSFEGNIGSGKSTALRACAALLGRPALVEPLDDWAPWLARLYASDPPPPGAALGMQLRAVVSHKAQVGQENGGGGASSLLVERSHLSATEVFGDVWADRGGLSPDEKALLRESVAALDIRPPGLVVYVSTPAAVCEARAAARGDSPNAIGLIAGLGAAYDAWAPTLAFRGIPCVVLDGLAAPEVVAARAAAAVRAWEEAQEAGRPLHL